MKALVLMFVVSGALLTAQQQIPAWMIPLMQRPTVIPGTGADLVMQQERIRAMQLMNQIQAEQLRQMQAMRQGNQSNAPSYHAAPAPAPAPSASPAPAPQGLAGAFDPTTVRTAGMSNGRYWKTLSAEDKVIWFLAYADGVAGGAMFFGGGMQKAATILPMQLTPAESREALDRFYDLPENLPLPLSAGIFLVSFKASGAEVKAVEDLTAQFRRAAAGTLVVRAEPSATFQ